MNTTHQPAILARHEVSGLLVTRFATRFGDVIWLITDPSLPGHGGLFQGSRSEAAGYLRKRLR